MIVHGMNDRTVPYTASVKLAATLKNVIDEENVKLILEPGARHSVAVMTPNNLQQAAIFFEKIVSPLESLDATTSVPVIRGTSDALPGGTGTLFVYNDLGKLIFSTAVNNTTSQVPLTEKGIYILKINHQTAKIICL
jgi:hypothetical protein